jgi:hypothetical protein
MNLALPPRVEQRKGIRGFTRLLSKQRCRWEHVALMLHGFAVTQSMTKVAEGRAEDACLLTAHESLPRQGLAWKKRKPGEG